MSDLYDIIWVPDPVLKQVAQPVDKVDDDLRKQMDKMLRTMYDAPGIGLAANQVGLLNRVIVVDLSKREEEEQGEPLFMVNPEIVKASEEISVMEEGCLSIPGQYAEVERPAEVVARYIDYNGKEQEIEADGLLSHCIQHEIDHLNGVLFIDYISRLKRSMMIKKVQKLAR